MTLHVLRLPLSLDPLIAEAKRRARRRRVLVAISLLAVAGLTAGLTFAFRSPGGGPSGGSATATYQHYGVSLRYPSAWARVDWCLTGVHVLPIALLTTARPRPTCNADAKSWTWPPPEHLGTNGISVALSDDARLALKPTWNARIAGQPANVLPPQYGRKHAASLTCPAGVQVEVRSVTIRRPAATNVDFAVVAVICGPDLAAGNRALRHLLASVRFTK